MAKNESTTEESVDERVAKAVAKAIAEALPLMAGVLGQSMVQAQADIEAKKVQTIDTFRLTGERCQVCRQILPRGVKQGDHTHKRMIVWANYNSEYFQGVRINGVQYLSNDDRHHILVPADANVEYLVAQWENNERVTAEGRKHSHNSGNLNNPQRATAAWR